MKLQISLLDEYGEPCCANVGIFSNDERLWRGYIENFVELDLPKNDNMTVVVRRGKLYEPIRKTFAFKEDRAFSFTLTRIIDPKLFGFYAFDAHGHISRVKLGEDAPMDIPKMAVRARGEDWNVLFAGTPYDGENHYDVYHKRELPIQSYRAHYHDTLENVRRKDFLADPGGEFVKYRYGHYVLANFDETPPVDKFRDPMYPSYEANSHVPNVEVPPFTNVPPSRAISTQRDENSFAFFAHPTSWWRIERSGAFVTNVASTIGFDALTGMLDAMVVQGYGADKVWYRKLWYRLLNEGFRITGISETDHCGDDPDHLTGKRTVEPFRTYAHCGELSLNAVSAAVRAGDCFATSGPLLDYTVDCARPGSVLPFEAAKSYKLHIKGWPCCEGRLSRFVVVVNGEEAMTLTPDANNEAEAEITLPKEGYVLCLLYDEAENVAVGNPVYVRNTPFVNTDYKAEVTLHILRNGSGANGTYTTDESQDPIVFDSKIHCRINPMTRVFVTVDGITRTYEPFFDRELQDCFRYTYSGAFLKDYPDCKPGQVPDAAYRIPEILSRLQHLEETLDFGFSEDAGKRLLSPTIQTFRKPKTPIENAFKTEKSVEYIPDKETFLSSVPKIHWERHKNVEDCMARAFAIAYSKLQKQSEGSGFPRPLLYTEFADSVFMWGNCFNTMYGEFAPAFPFIELLDDFYAKQDEDGFICRQLSIHTGEGRFEKHDPSSTGPDIFSLAEWLHYQKTDDKGRLAKVYPVLLAYHRWLKKHRTWPGGAYFSSGWGSGMDNIPRTPDPDYDHAFDTGHLSLVDTTAQMALDCKLLLEFAEISGTTEGKQELSEEFARLSSILNDRMWNEKDDFYEDLTHEGIPSGVKHIGGFWPLLTGIVPKERQEKMLTLLQDENEFSSPVGTRTLTRSHPKFVANGGNYWQGGVWCITELMVILGLEAIGQRDLAHRMARRHVEGVAQVFAETGTIWESYDPMTVAPGRLYGNLVRREFVGFSGVTPIFLAIEEVLGVKVRGSDVHWSLRLSEPHGIENLTVSGSPVSLFCEKGKVTVNCVSPFTLILNGREIPMLPGTTVLRMETQEKE